MNFHTGRGSTYTASSFMKLCRKMGIGQSMGRAASGFDNAAAEAFFSSLEWEVLSRHRFVETRQAQAVVLEWGYGFYNHTRRRSSAGMMAPITYETTALNRERPKVNRPRFGGEPQVESSTLGSEGCQTARFAAQ